jgi:stringent starvation protein B
MATRVPGKKQVLLAFLDRGVAMLHLDARRPGVQVPQQHAQDAHLRLNLSYRYGIPDFDVGDQRVQATLSFGGRPFRCIIPWTAVFGITCSATRDGQVWPEDIPADVVDEAHGEEAPVKPQLSAVSTQAAVEKAEEPKPPERTPPRGNLRLVR